jgi:para-aminobenzoate synthetase / 4-amino-4-deoxychorismate lyase
MLLDFDTTKPFVLLEDSQGEGETYLFTQPVERVYAFAPSDVAQALVRVRAAQTQGLWAAGWLGYDFATAYEPRTARATAAMLDTPAQWPVLWFGLFSQRQRLDPVAREALWRTAQPTPVRAGVHAVTPLWSEQAYQGAVRQVLDLIEAGDAYQVNLTLPLSIDYSGTPLALYAHLREAQRVPFGALLFDGSRYVLSFSPEQFITRMGNRLQARPMKGTAPLAQAGIDLAQAGTDLAQDAKNKAENLMIVDLLRNDLSRIARPGSVKTPKLFALERYQTLWQMTSTIEATLADGLDMLDVLKALMPCGSVTGAPKIRAQEIINAIEPTPRGLYCGAIGWIAPNTHSPPQAGFSVAIRTLEIVAPAHPHGGQARMGVGAGIVAQSNPHAEWAESMLKAQFLRQPQPPFDLLETLRWTPHTGFWLLETHLERLENSARALNFKGDVAEWRAVLQAASQHWQVPKRVRLLLARLGQVCVQASALPAPNSRPLTLGLAPLPLQAYHLNARHKSSNRHYWDAPRAQQGCDELLFYDAQGFVCEGSFTSLFVQRTPDSLLETPGPAHAVLPGVLAHHLQRHGLAKPASLRVEDVRHAWRIYMGNSVRGLMRAQLHAEI